MPDLLTTRLIAGVADLSEPIAAGDAYPPGGPAAALVVALAAAVTAAAAERARAEWEEAGAARAQAQALRRRALELAQRDVAAYAEARRRLTNRGLPGGATQDWQLGQAVLASAEPLEELAACARDLAQLAELLAAHAPGDLRPDLAVAAILSTGAARAAAHLVEINLVAGADEERVDAARSHVLEAEKAASAAGKIR